MEGFKPEPMPEAETVELGGAESSPEVIEMERSGESVESIELTLDDKYKLVGKKDSILDKRGIHISVAKLNELLISGLVITSLNDIEAVADDIVEKLNESREIKTEEEIEEDVKFRKNEIRKYVSNYGLNEFAMGLIEEWTRASLKWVEIDGTVRAKILHRLRTSELYRAGGDDDTGITMAREAYNIAIETEDVEMIQAILGEFPQLEEKDEE